MNDDERKAALVRKVAGAFATGITIVAVNDDEVHGMTANSFVSISLRPPLVLFSVQLTATILKSLHLDTHVGISILREDQVGLSRHFAGEKQDDLQVRFVRQTVGPVLEDCLGWLCTKVHRMIPCGDHVMVVCEVLEGDRSEGQPLLYYGGYQTLMS
ncbi:MAG: flavin reductase family protein [Saprospiraceae bacterium]|nr:flavin reductase family protein [Saprospiraceae bacterium]